MKIFAKSIIDTLPIAIDDVHISFTRFETDFSHVSYLNKDSYNRDKIKATLDAQQYTDVEGETHLGSALYSVRQDVFESDTRVRNADDIAKIIIVLTDGRANDRLPSKHVEVIAPELHKAGYNIFAVGITDSVDEDQLYTLTGVQDHIFRVQQFDLLHQKIEELKEKICKTDCKVSQWSTWGSCSYQCNHKDRRTEGRRKRQRMVLSPSVNGVVCPVLEELAPCANDCNVDCEVSKWQNSTCQASCSRNNGGDVVNGVMIQTRRIINDNFGSGLQCPDLKRQVECKKTCPVDCVMSPYKRGPCSANCGPNDKGKVTGIAFSTAKILVQPEFGGEPCTPIQVEEECSEECNVNNKHCELSDWFLYVPCNATCNDSSNRHSGVEIWKRNATKIDPNSNLECEDIGEFRSCQGSCPNDCEVSSFGPWEACDATCGNNNNNNNNNNNMQNNAIAHGFQYRRRKVISPAKEGGQDCPKLYISEPCEKKCDVDCVYTEWSDIGVCNAKCSNGQSSQGTVTQQRVILFDRANDGKKCDGILERVSTCVGVCPQCLFEQTTVCEADCDSVSSENTVTGNKVSSWKIVSEHVSTCIPPASENIGTCTKKCKSGPTKGSSTLAIAGGAAAGMTGIFGLLLAGGFYMRKRKVAAEKRYGSDNEILFDIVDYSNGDDDDIGNINGDDDDDIQSFADATSKYNNNNNNGRKNFHLQVLNKLKPNNNSKDSSSRSNSFSKWNNMATAHGNTDLEWVPIRKDSGRLYPAEKIPLRRKESEEQLKFMSSIRRSDSAGEKTLFFGKTHRFTEM
eukprot:Pgem_evm1s15126